MILGDVNAVVIQRYTEKEYVGEPTVEASGRDPQSFKICLGGNDYYAAYAELNVSEATVLRNMLNAWLVQH